MENGNVQKIEQIVMEYSGPMGKFVVRKQLKDTSRTIEQLTDGEKRKLIGNIVEGAIFNESYQAECKKRLTSALMGKTFT